MGLRISTILEQKSQGQELSGAQLRFFVEQLVSGEITDAQIAAFCAFTLWQGMSTQETVELTLAMADSSPKMQWDLPADTTIIDKHSTGGVGDKVSLILAPLWATLGYKVPMVSARGAGYTGGTLDKIESIYGMQTHLPHVCLKEILQDVGCFIVGSDERIVPADKVLYDIRNETSTVSSVPLIVSSILSKKLSEGINSLVLDVKYGCGTHMKTRTQAYHLAVAIEDVAVKIGLDTRIVLSDMNQPLGFAVGNSLEVEEAIRCMKGEGPTDLEELVCQLSGESAALETLRSGAVFDTFARMIETQGGDLSRPFADACKRRVLVRSNRSGRIVSCDAYKIGYANLLLGGGRTTGVEEIHHGVGIQLFKKKDDDVRDGERLAEAFVCDDGTLDEALNLIQEAYTII